MTPPPSSSAVTRTLCLTCGLCCNGALFKDVELQPGDDPTRLQALGLPLINSRTRRRQEPGTDNPQSATRKLKFSQPCAALGADCRCRIYPDRPSRCRDFECALFKAVSAGQVETETALRTIRTARQRADRVRQVLRELGDADEQLALSLRFRRTKKRLEAGAANDESAEIFSQLTLAVHDLNLWLREKFYPDPGD